MRRLFLFAATAIPLAGAPVSVQAANWVLNFEELQRGEIVDSQYSSGIPGSIGTSVDISAVGGQADLAVVFDTHSATVGGSGSNDGDSDLSHPFDNTPADFGNILIVQEGYNGTQPCGSSTCLGGGIIPDDAIGGAITFDFGDTPTDLTSIDYFDIESSTDQAMSLEITYADASMVSQQMAVVGDHDWGVFNFTGSLGQNVTKLVAVFKGSGAIDNLRGQDRGITSVNEPATLAMFLIGLIGFSFYRRH